MGGLYGKEEPSGGPHRRDSTLHLRTNFNHTFNKAVVAVLSSQSSGHPSCRKAR